MINKSLYNEILELLDVLKGKQDNNIEHQLCADVLKYFNKMSDTERKSDEIVNNAFTIFKNMSYNSRRILSLASFRQSLNLYLKENESVYSYVDHKFLEEKIPEYRLRKNRNYMQIAACKETGYIVNLIVIFNDKTKYDEFIKMLKTPETFRKSVENYLNNDPYLSDTDRKLVIKNTNEFYEYYLNEYSKVLEKEKEEKYINYVKEFENESCYDIKKFCYKRRINIDIFMEYLEKLGIKIEEEVSFDTELANKIFKNIVNGIDDDMGIREFDSLDYYSLTKLPISSLKEQLVNFKCNPSDKRKISSFIRKNDLKPLTRYEKETLVKGIVTLNPEFDKYGNIIPGSGRKITEEEKLSIMDYIVSKGIPLNSRTYKDAYERYKKNILFKEEDSKKLVK